MTTPVALIGLTYRGTDLQEWPPGVFLELDASALFGQLEVVGSDQPLLSGGVFPRNRIGRRRKLPLFGIVSGDPTALTVAEQRETLFETLATLETLFALSQHGDLVATLPDGSTRTIDARPEVSPLVTLSSDTLAVYSIDLTSYDTPDWTIGP